MPVKPGTVAFEKRRTRRFLCWIGAHRWCVDTSKLVFASGIVVGPCKCLYCGLEKVRRI